MDYDPIRKAWARFESFECDSGSIGGSYWDTAPRARHIEGKGSRCGHRDCAPRSFQTVQVKSQS